ncbi:MAG: molybdopterin-dependent oxidoreductase, partial [Nitrospirota bacterium]
YMKIDKKHIQQRLRLSEVEVAKDESNPFFERDHNKCVLCGICVRTCQEIAKVSAIDFAGRGGNTKIATFGDKPIADSRCVSCGECVIRCPVGALTFRNLRRPAKEVKTICPYCSVGCGILLGVRDDTVINVRGDIENPVSRGYVCVKGRFGLGFVHSPERLTSPLIRKNKSNPLTPPFTKGGLGGFAEVSWEEALDLVASRLNKYKGEEFALIASTKCTNEDNYIAQKFARVVMSSNNIDTSARLCHTSSISALLETEVGTAFKSLDEIGRSACILIVGANVTSSHPIVGLKIKKAVENGAKLIVISPKEIDICRFALVWLKPYPGTDLALIMGMGKVIFDEGLYDNASIEKQCDNFEDFKDSLDGFPSGRVERITGVSRNKVEEAARIFATSKPAAIFWSTGVTQFSQGRSNVLAILNLSLLTGNAERSYPLWGQNNALGAWYVGCMPDFYPGFQPVKESGIRKKFEAAWGVDLNPEPGLTFTEILSALIEEKIKALYIIGSDPVLNAPAQLVREALKKAEFIVLQDIFLNKTAEFAHVILPAVSFAEKDGTFTNTEGRIQKIRKAVEPVGNSRPDWQIICDLAKRLGSGGFDFASPEDIAFEISSIIPELPDRKDSFRLTPLQYKPPAEVSDIDYPLILITERDLYSGGLLSKKVEGLNILRTKDFVYINPKDAADFEIKDGEAVKVISRWGEISGVARLTSSTPSGLVMMNLLEEKINQLVNPSIDPTAKTPELKICAVRVTAQI